MSFENTTSTETTAPVQQNVTITMKDSRAEVTYANFFRVNSTTEEIILEVGLNPHPLGTERVELEITQRLVLNPFTAKRLAMALAETIKRHEHAFGTIEIDPRKRVKLQANMSGNQ